MARSSSLSNKARAGPAGGSNPKSTSSSKQAVAGSKRRGEPIDDDENDDDDDEEFDSQESDEDDDVGDDDDDEEDEEDANDDDDELVDSEEDEFEVDRQKPRVAVWEDDEGEGSELEDDEDDEEAEGSVRHGSKVDKGKGREKELARLQNDLKALPLSTLLKAQRSLPSRSDRDRTAASDSEGDEDDDQDDEEVDRDAEKRARVAEAREKLAAMMRAKKGIVETPHETEERKSREKKALAKRADKHAPTEISSKRPVSRKRTVIEVEKVERRDPRFSTLSGRIDPHLHAKAYSFLPEMLKDELSNLQGQLAIARKAVLSSSRAERAEKEADVVRIENELGKVRTRKEREGRERREREALTGWKREERNKREEGKGAWHLKEGEKKRILAEAKHKALLEQGGQFAVKKSLDKKLKKEAGKEKKQRPRGLDGPGGGGQGNGDGPRKRIKM